jgi:hypothetical protein
MVTFRDYLILGTIRNEPTSGNGVLMCSRRSRKPPIRTAGNREVAPERAPLPTFCRSLFFRLKRRRQGVEEPLRPDFPTCSSRPEQAHPKPRPLRYPLLTYCGALLQEPYIAASALVIRP